MIRFVGFVENLNQLSLRLDINNLIYIRKNTNCKLEKTKKIYIYAGIKTKTFEPY